MAYLIRLTPIRHFERKGQSGPVEHLEILARER